MNTQTNVGIRLFKVNALISLVNLTLMFVPQSKHVEVDEQVHDQKDTPQKPLCRNRQLFGIDDRNQVMLDKALRIFGT